MAAGAAELRHGAAPRDAQNSAAKQHVPRLPHNTPSAKFSLEIWRGTRLSLRRANAGAAPPARARARRRAPRAPAPDRDVREGLSAPRPPDRPASSPRAPRAEVASGTPKREGPRPPPPRRAGARGAEGRGPGMGPEWDAPEVAAARERSRAALAPLAANRGPEAGPCGLAGRIVVVAAAAPAVRVRVRAPAGGEAVQLLCRDGQRRYATRLAGHSHPHLDFELRGVRFGRCKLLHAQLLLRAKALAPEEPMLLLSDAPLARDVALLADAAPPGKRAALVARLGLLLEQYDGLGWAVGAEPEAAGPRLDAFAQDAEGLLRMACLAGLPQLTSQLMSILEHLHLAYNAPRAGRPGELQAHVGPLEGPGRQGARGERRHALPRGRAGPRGGGGDAAQAAGVGGLRHATPLAAPNKGRAEPRGLRAHGWQAPPPAEPRLPLSAVRAVRGALRSEGWPPRFAHRTVSAALNPHTYTHACSQPLAPQQQSLKAFPGRSRVIR